MIYRWCREGRDGIPLPHTRANGRVLITLGDLQKFLAATAGAKKPTNYAFVGTGGRRKSGGEE